MLLEETRDQLRRILQVAVHHDDDVSRRVVERGRERRLVAEVAGQRHPHDPRVPRGRGDDGGKGPVGAAVVHEHDLVGAARELVQDRADPAQELRKDLLFVVQRDRDGDPRRSGHGRRLPLKYTMFKRVTPNIRPSGNDQVIGSRITPPHPRGHRCG